MAEKSYFNYEVALIDPGNYYFVDKDSLQQDILELEAYEDTVPMTPMERAALRMWVAQGHSFRECPAPLYARLGDSSYRPDFLDVYRMDRKIAFDLRGLSPEDKAAYLENLGTPAFPYKTAKAVSPGDRGETHYKKLCRQLLALWDYLALEGLYDDAKGYLEEHWEDDFLPFSFLL